MANSDVDIANKALMLFGSAPVQNFDDATRVGRVVKGRYYDVIDGLLSEYPWSFTKQTMALAALSEPLQPDARLVSGWRYVYQLPAEALAPPEAYIADPRFPQNRLKSFAVMGDSVYCDRDAVWAIVCVRVEPSAWPPYFTMAAIACLAAEFVMPISGNAGLRTSLQEEAWGTPEERRMGGKLGAAKASDARNSGPRSLVWRDPLTDARWT